MTRKGDSRSLYQPWSAAYHADNDFSAVIEMIRWA
jgi:hypothetical protein